MTSPIKHNLNDVYRGDRRELYFRYRESTIVNGEEVPGDYIDLTGWVPTGKIKLSLDDPPEAIVAQWSCTLDDQTNPDTKGGVTCVLLPAESQKLDEPKYVYDIQLVKDAANIKTAIYGEIKTIKDVTPNV